MKVTEALVDHCFVDSLSRTRKLFEPVPVVILIWGLTLSCGRSAHLGREIDPKPSAFDFVETEEDTPPYGHSKARGWAGERGVNPLHFRKEQSPRGGGPRG